jgi:peptidoglycan/LPS O-acetylase OafA/YrhL
MSDVVQQLNGDTSKRLAHIDALRGIAALLVIHLHVTEVFHRLPLVRAQGDLLYLIAKYLDTGRLGVVIFFAISGFVICPTLTGDRVCATRDFVIKRLFRLYPAYWLAIVLGSFAVWISSGRPLSASLYLANITMIPTLFDVDNMMGLLWTLEVELVFYSLCLVLFWSDLLDKPRSLFICCTVLLIIFGAVQLNWLPSHARSSWRAMPYHLALMFWGGLVRHLYDHRQSVIRFGSHVVSIKALVSVTFIFCTAPLAAASIYQWTNTSEIKNIVLALSYFLGLSVFLLITFKLQIKHPLFIWLGSISYSTYLFHPVIFTPVYVWARHHREHPFAQLHMGAYLTLTIILTLILANFVYRFIETPSNRFARKLTMNFRNQK